MLINSGLKENDCFLDLPENATWYKKAVLKSKLELDKLFDNKWCAEAIKVIDSFDVKYRNIAHKLMKQWTPPQMALNQIKVFVAIDTTLSIDEQNIAYSSREIAFNPISVYSKIKAQRLIDRLVNSWDDRCKLIVESLKCQASEIDILFCLFLNMFYWQLEWELKQTVKDSIDNWEFMYDVICSVWLEEQLCSFVDSYDFE